MLRCKGIDSSAEDRSLFRIDDDENPAAEASLGKVARLGDVLLAENRLSGCFRVEGPGRLALELPVTERTFFHNGIVFAALDAFNDPVRNPTLTMSAEEPPA